MGEKMDVELPTWLTMDYITTALKQEESTSNILSIENMEIDMPVAKGNNYACCIYRVRVIYKVKEESSLKNISLIVKAPKDGSRLNDFMENMGIFNKEVMIYNELIPKYRSVFLNEWPDLTAKSFYSSITDVVILEDLKVKGYIMADRIKQLDFEECAVALSMLAKFHAASVKLYQTEPDLIKKMGREVIFREDLKEACEIFVIKIFDNLIDEINSKEIRELEKYINKLKKCREIIFDTLTEMIKPKEGEFNVLNHGDFWTTNMMIKYIDNKPVDIKALDLQISRYTSPAFDIIYFMAGSVQEDVRTEKYDTLLNIYLEKLNLYLKIFGCEKRLNITELKKAIEERHLFGVYVTVCVLPLLIGDPNNGELIDFKELDIDDMLNNKMFMSGYFSNPKYINMISKRFEEFDNKGWFLSSLSFDHKARVCSGGGGGGGGGGGSSSNGTALRIRNRFESGDRGEKMDVELPTWLTMDYITTALKQEESTSNILSIENMEIDMPVAKGNNYACCIYRVKVIYKVKEESSLKNISLIVKAPKDGLKLNDFMENMGIFNKEVMIYNELIPKYRSVFLNEWPDLTAKSFYSSIKDVVILEDLKVKGYVMADRIKQLDFEECSVALSMLAKFHAASVKLYQTEPDLIKKMGREALFREDLKETFELYVITIFENLIGEIKHKEIQVLQKYINKLKKFREIIFDTLTEMIKPKEDEFNVLNHGDFWTTNMMFKYIDNIPVDIKALDLQISRYTSPAFDIIYFMAGSVQEDVRTEKYDTLLNIYLEKLNLYLKLFGCEKRLNITELKKAIEERQLFGVYVTVCVLPVLIGDPNNGEFIDFKEVDIDDMLNNKMFMSGYFSNPKYINMISKRFEEFDNKGWFLSS
ncbi:uncharacterized protein LOC142317621 [Lycorma delicatula]|uniref:uncharacterized protein LOC142317621 n=1 Tax=Lycorma delicatula TaxID=130591 RepID=UPI003F516A79